MALLHVTPAATLEASGRLARAYIQTRQAVDFERNEPLFRIVKAQLLNAGLPILPLTHARIFCEQSIKHGLFKRGASDA